MNLALVLTHDCNLGCTYCYAGAKFRRHMTAAVADRALDWALSLADGALHVSFFGGEPLLRADEILRIAKRAREAATYRDLRLTMAVTTNGTLLDAVLVEQLGTLGVYIALSIDGGVAAQDEGRPMMGGGSSFAATARGLDLILAAGRRFETVSVVTPENAKYLAQSVDWLVDRDVSRIGLNPNYEAAFADAEIADYEAGLERAAGRVIERFRQHRELAVVPFDNKINGAIKGGLLSTDMCGRGIGRAAVAPSGNLYACERDVGEDDDGSRVIGHIDIGIDPQKIACARRAVNEICVNCAVRPRCSSHCACANRAETGDPDQAGGMQCWHERTTARLADHIASTLWEERNETFLARYYRPALGSDRRLPVVARD